MPSTDAAFSLALALLTATGLLISSLSHRDAAAGLQVMPTTDQAR